MRRHQWMEKVGEGFSGEVYRVYNEEEERESAIKIQKNFEGQEIFIGYHLNELEGFVQTRDAWVQEGGTSCIEMELADGNLGQLVMREKFSLKDRLEVYFEIVYALEEAHIKMGFFHGDLRLQNILFQKTFGIRSYHIKGTNYIMRSKIRPLIADFGRSSLLPVGNVIQEDDLSYLKVLQEKLFSPTILPLDPMSLVESKSYIPLLMDIGRFISEQRT